MKPEIIDAIVNSIQMNPAPELLEILPQTVPPNSIWTRLEDHLHAERDKLVSLLQQIEAINNTMQQNTEHGGAAWHNHETLDDRLHDALVLIGE